MRRFFGLALILLATASCGASSSSLDSSDFDFDVPWEDSDTIDAKGPAYHAVSYHLTWGGARIGEAREVYRQSERGVRIVRTETITVQREGTEVESSTEVIIDTDLQLRATRVELESRLGAVHRRGVATRADDGSWVIALDGEQVRRASRDAIPLELIPYLLAAKNDDRVDAEVLIAGYGFAVTPLRLRREGRKGKAVLETPWGEIETTMRLAGDGTLMQASAGSTGSVRVDPESLHDQFEPPEMLGTSSIPVAGKGSVLRLEGLAREPPALSPGLSVRELAGAWEIHFDDKARRSPDQIGSIVREVGRLLEESHDAPGAGAKAALALGRGDCTAHAALFVDLARERGLDAQVVTGFRLDDKRLVRHRWAVVKHNEKWIEVDPTFGESPVPLRTHVALAVHGPNTADMALVDEATFRGLANVKAKWIPRNVAAR